MVTLIIGEPSTGKTTYARDHLGNGVCYDLDHIASALRLNLPNAERHEVARILANILLGGFREYASRYTDLILIIRTAPTINELEEIDPDVLVVCDKPRKGKHGNEITFDRTDFEQKIEAAEQWAMRKRVTVKRYPPRP